ncbi:hypothetical protein [Hymenobacter sp. AT01-02]|uniref:hypothetical protein n=1 Tax=Hymenobacter sp. AT01-02 TaxID=1571877 RepID=UPI0005F22703|nr:hypothetical protein [Hymenobacter sp. AT01-02]
MALTLGIQHTCLTPGPGAELRVTVRASDLAAVRPRVFATVSKNGQEVYSGTVAKAANTFRFTPVADGTYSITATDQDGETETRDYTIKCGTVAGGGTDASADACDLAISDVVVYSPTTPGGTGSVAFTLSTTAASILASVSLVSNPSNPVGGLAGPQAPGRHTIYNLPVGELQILTGDSRGCSLPLYQFTVKEAPAPPPEPVVPPVPLWFAVGGLQPRPALLPTPVSKLLTSANQPRVGLHVQVELRRPEEERPFARLRKAARRLDEVVDLSEALHQELVPEVHYPQRVVAHDEDATLPFRVRYREVDAEGEGEWKEQDVTHYAVLSAVPALLPVSTYLADAPTPASPLSAFRSGQAVHWAGLPLDVAVWLPERAADAVWFAEFLYRNGANQEVEIRTLELPASLPPGVTRIPLPDSPPTTATTVTVTLRNPPRETAGNEPLPDKLPVHDFLIPDVNDNDFR